MLCIALIRRTTLPISSFVRIYRILNMKQSCYKQEVLVGTEGVEDARGGRVADNIRTKQGTRARCPLYKHSTRGALL